MRRAIAILVLALALPEGASAHGIAGVRDLPVPLWLFYYGAAVVLVVSFVALGALWRRPVLEQRADSGRPLPAFVQRVLLSRAVRLAAGAASFALLVLVLLAALLGPVAVTQNLAPTFVYVVFWLGLVPVVVVLGDVWRVLNPWRAAADAVAWVVERVGVAWEPLARYPEQLGRWPAAVLLFAFAALELAYTDPANPGALAVAIFLYSYVTWLGMLVFGRSAWLANGEAFSVYFGLLARIAPFTVRARERGREIVVRTPLAGLSAPDSTPGILAFVAVMLGSVLFDGLSRTTFWQERQLDVGLSAESLRLAELQVTLLNLGGLAACVAGVALAYVAALAVARLLTGAQRALAPAFVWSLVPIALGYTIAHYFSLLVLQGQYAIPLLSDPLDRGWDLFGTSGWVPTVQTLSPNTTWYVQVAALVAGHVLGLALAHDRAISLFRSARAALRTQYALLALMVVYTVGGLWLLSQG